MRTMDDNTENRNEEDFIELKISFDDIKKELGYFHKEWLDAKRSPHSHRELAVLISRENEFLRNLNVILTLAVDLMDYKLKKT